VISLVTFWDALIGLYLPSICRLHESKSQIKSSLTTSLAKNLSVSLCLTDHSFIDFAQMCIFVRKILMFCLEKILSKKFYKKMGLFRLCFCFVVSQKLTHPMQNGWD
jgi:hypothetical protein